MDFALFLIKWVLSRILIIIPVQNPVSQSVIGNLLYLHCIPIGWKCTLNTIRSAGAQAICETFLNKEHLKHHRRIPIWRWPVKGFLQLVSWNSQATHHPLSVILPVLHNFLQKCHTSSNMTIVGIVGILDCAKFTGFFISHLLKGLQARGSRLALLFASWECRCSFIFLAEFRAIF